MNKLQIGIAMLMLSGCAGGTSAQNTARLTANADAQHFGIGGYVVQGDGAILLDQNGVELGTMAISAPVTERRLIQFELVDGSTDEVEVHRPKADGTFFAPITPATVTTAAVADSALAPLFANYGVKFHVYTAPLLAPTQGSLSADTLATTTICNGGCQTGKPWTCTTPAGCVRSANTSVGCTNPSQLPPDMYSDTGVGFGLAGQGYTSQSTCLASIGAYCDSTLGAGNYDFTSCDLNGTHWIGTCIGRSMVSEYKASCPRSTCATVGQYDLVPRQDQCYDPGSCTFQQGTVGCTVYH